MHTLSNLRLGARLGAAFGLVVLALVLVAAIGIGSMSSLGGRVDVLVERGIPAVENLLLAARTAQESATLTVTHLYVEDGDLEAQDATAGRIAANDEEIDRRLALADRVIDASRTSAALGAYVEAREAYDAAAAPALELSRRETVDAVEDRDGSRGQYLEQVVPAAQAMNERLAEVRELVLADAATEASAAEASVASGRRLIAIVAIVAVLLAIALATLITRSVTRPVTRVLETLRSLREHCITSLTGSLKAIAAGDLTVPAASVTQPIENPSRDEIGQVAVAVNGIREMAVGSIEACNRSRESLTEMIDAINGTSSTLSSASTQMATTSDETGKAVGEIAAAVSEVAQGAELQVRTVDNVKALTERMVAATQLSADTARQTADAARDAHEVAEQGASQVTQATDAMVAVRESSTQVSAAIELLSDKSQQIGGIVGTITGIAEQTNLLALNAAIEAARAGEQGRGFAVVADEVRKLAEEARTAAATISGLIGEIQAETRTAVEIVEQGARRTEQGAATVEQARAGFLQIAHHVEDMSGRVEEIAAAVSQVASSSRQVQAELEAVAAVAEESSASSEEVSASTQQTSASAQEIAASAQSLASTADSLNALVGRFTLRR